MLAASLAFCQPAQADRGEVEVQGKELLRDGRRWIPHGFYQIAFEVAPGNLGSADHPFWATAYNKYTPEEYSEMRKAGADSVRLQIAQMGADPQSPLFDRQFFEKALGAIRAARAAGLTVIVCVQDESHVPGDKPIDLPDEGTRRVWKEIAPQFPNDRGVLFELLNEPRPTPNPRNWKRWKAAMTETIRTVRETGARNVVIADGLGVGQVIDGAPLLDDPQVAYASHPYARQQHGQTRQAWDEKFGNFSRRAPVIITEWLSGGYFCDAATPESPVKFVNTCKSMGSDSKRERGIGRQGVLAAPAGASRTASSRRTPAFPAISLAMVWGGSSRPGTPPVSLRTPLNSWDHAERRAAWTMAGRASYEDSDRFRKGRWTGCLWRQVRRVVSNAISDLVKERRCFRAHVARAIICYGRLAR